MLSRFSNPFAALYFWATKPNKPSHDLDMSRLITNILDNDISNAPNNIAFIEKTFAEATDHVIHDRYAKKYYINRHVDPRYNLPCWRDFFEDLKGLAVNFEGRSDWTLLAAAACNNDLDLAKWLIEHQGANANHGTNTSPFIIAASRGHIDMMRYLLMKGVDINYQARKCINTTALHQAVTFGQVKAIEYLILHDAKLLQNSNGVTSLELAEKIYDLNQKNEPRTSKHIKFGQCNDITGEPYILPSSDNIMTIIDMLKNAYEHEVSHSPRLK